jgi:NADH-quinone oxidoreductase subunit J
MTFLRIIFILAAFMTLGSALMVVSARKIMHAALWLILSLFGVAVLFALMQSRFIAIVQVIVYVGAIAILIIFGLMLTRRPVSDEESQFNSYSGYGALVVLIFFVLLVYSLTSWPGFNLTEQSIASSGEDLVQLGQAFVDPMGFLIPFEAASVLLLAAMLGAIFVAASRKRGE